MAEIKIGQPVSRRLGDLLIAEGLIDQEQLQKALARGDRARIQEEMGDVFFSLVNVARLSDIDAEEALQAAIEKFRRRFTHMEADLIARGKDTRSVTPEELERLWQGAKADEHDAPEPPQ